MTHDYNRHDTTTLFPALDVRTGLAIGDVKPRHHAKEFLGFQRKIDRAVKKGLDVHLVLDNYAAHKTPEVQAWLSKHPRFDCHFTPTSASWLNLVERFFAEITTKRIRLVSFVSIADPKPFVWTTRANDILARERRASDLLDLMRDGNQPSVSEHSDRNWSAPSSRCRDNAPAIMTRPSSPLSRRSHGV